MTNPIQGLPVIVDVTAHPPGSPDPYTIDWRFQGQPSQGNTVIILPPGSGSHDMTFNLIDNSGKGLRFKAQANDAMWTRSGNSCPTGPGNGSNQMSKGAVSADRMQLTINDDNSGNARRLKYALRFDPDPNMFDPDIRNGGTGITPPTTITSIGGAVLGVAATFLIAEATTMNVLLGAVIGAVIGYLSGLVFSSIRERSSEGVR